MIGISRFAWWIGGLVVCAGLHGETPPPTRGHDVAKAERSLWLNASLAAPKLGYWSSAFAPPPKPTDAEIANAARILIGDACPNRLYLIHHRELPFDQASAVFRAWRKACPPSVEIVPALVLRMYDKEASPVFTADEFGELLSFFKAGINPERIAVYDVLPRRDQGPAFGEIARQFPRSLIRLGLQPSEALPPPFAAAVEDTWSAFCHGLTNDDWQDRGFGRDTLRNWVVARNRQPVPIAYDLIVVAWDYTNTKRGEYPGYDDAHKNMPLPAGRNRLAAAEILAHADPGRLAGFSSDLLILQLNSETPEHDGKADSFYDTLKAGRSYDGYFAEPWREVCSIFKRLSEGRLPSSM